MWDVKVGYQKSVTWMLFCILLKKNNIPSCSFKCTIRHSFTMYLNYRYEGILNYLSLDLLLDLKWGIIL